MIKYQNKEDKKYEDFCCHFSANINIFSNAYFWYL